MLRVIGTKKIPTAQSEGLWRRGLGISDVGSPTWNNRSYDSPLAKFAVSLFPATHHLAIVLRIVRSLNNDGYFLVLVQYFLVRYDRWVASSGYPVQALLFIHGSDGRNKLEIVGHGCPPTG